MELHQFFSEKHFILKKAEAYEPCQIGSLIKVPQRDGWDAIDNAEVIILTCIEHRGSAAEPCTEEAINQLREAFYKMYSWHNEIKLADVGNLLSGAQLSDTEFALNTVLDIFINQMQKKVVILGGSHHLTLSQYKAFVQANKMVDCCIIDKLIDLRNEGEADERFLYDMLTNTPNFVKNFAAMAFQSYYTNPNIIETLDRLNFDCYRLGKVREEIDEMEPALRSSAFVSIDMLVMKHSDAPGIEGLSPNGLMGNEICKITRYAGMSEACQSLGIFGIGSLTNEAHQTADLIAQMIWYYVDGIFLKSLEAHFSNVNMYNEFNVNTDGHLLKFLQNKRTKRWWIQLNENKYIGCSYNDYLSAANNNLPDRWLRGIAKLD
jgi:formiminoglutamase